MTEYLLLSTVVVAMSPFVELWDNDLDEGYNIMAGLREMYQWYHSLKEKK